MKGRMKEGNKVGFWVGLGFLLRFGRRGRRFFGVQNISPLKGLKCVWR